MDEASPGQQVRRTDTGVLGKLERTPQGGIRVPAALTRSGIFIYVDPSGKQIREYRPPEEVFRPESLATLQSAPVTDLHPPVMVTPDNFRQYSAGHVVEGSVKKDGDKVAAELVIQDGGLISAVDRGDRDQVSCGYGCMVEDTPGQTPSGERFDRIQRNVVYNHVAIVPIGRAGAEVALRLDAAGNQIPPGHTPGPEEKRTMKTIRIDGVDYPLNTDAEIQAAILAHKRHMDKLDAEAAAMKGQLDTTKGRMDAAEAKVADLTTKLAAANDPKRLDALVAARSTLVTDARKVMGADFKVDGLTDAEIRRQVVAKAQPAIKLDGASDDYVAGVFTGVVGRQDALDPDGLGDLRRGVNGNRQDAAPGKGKGTPDAEPDEDDTADGVKRKMDAAHRDAWTQPLAASKDSPRA